MRTSASASGSRWDRWAAGSPCRRRSTISSLPALLSLFTLFWVAGFDIIYATLDEEFDRKESLYSFPSRFGKERALRYSAIFARRCVPPSGRPLLLFGPLACSRLPLLLLTGYLLYLEQKKAEDVELAFFKINAVAGFVVLGHGRRGGLDMKIVVGITGSSGAVYALDFLKKCPDKKYLIVSTWGKVLLRDELKMGEKDLKPYVDPIVF